MSPSHQWPSSYTLCDILFEWLIKQNPSSGIAAQKVNTSEFVEFGSNYRVAFQQSCTNMYFYQQYMRALISPIFPDTAWVFQTLVFAILTGKSICYCFHFFYYELVTFIFKYVLTLIFKNQRSILKKIVSPISCNFGVFSRKSSS